LKKRPGLSTSLAPVIGLGAALVVASVALADFSQTDWRYIKSIDLPSELREEGLIELRPDVELFAAGASGLVDVRIIDGDESEVPYKIEVGKGESLRTSLSVSLQDLGYVPGRYTRFTADLGREGHLHNRIEFDTFTENFRGQGSVETSSDAITWATVAEEPVYDFTVSDVGRVSRDTEIRYPDSTARYLRVRISDDGDGQVEISGATVFAIEETPAREVSWPVSARSSVQDPDRQATLLNFDLGVSGLPTHRLRLDIADVNFYRDVTVETSLDGETWSGSGSRHAIYAFNTAKFVGESVEITYSEGTERYIRVVIFDQDNPPLTTSGAEVWGHERGIIFSANPEKTYSLYYGNAASRRPSYDIDRVLPYLATEDLLRAGLGPQTENSVFVPAVVPQPPISERLPWLFPLVAAAAAVIIGVMLFGILRRARSMLPPPG
jgi:hypothetical protein